MLKKLEFGGELCFPGTGRCAYIFRGVLAYIGGVLTSSGACWPILGVC